MQRVLACMPHFFRQSAPDSGMAHGSNRESLETRREQFSYCLRNLAAILEPVRFLMGSPGQIGHEQVEALRQGICGDLVVVTAPEDNLLTGVSRWGISQVRLWAGPPRQLGYQCRRVFARHVGQYHFYLFIEDDTTILDPTFFRKIAAFYRVHGDEFVLHPNRFEIYGPTAHGWRAYLDQPAFPRHRALEQPGPAELRLHDFDGDVVFRKTTDGMSGAYIITDQQLRRWMQQADFHAPDPTALAGGLDPLELTQIPLGGTLPIYRPAPQNIDFLEVHHVPNRLSALKTPSRKMRELLDPMLEERRRANQRREAILAVGLPKVQDSAFS